MQSKHPASSVRDLQEVLRGPQEVLKSISLLHKLLKQGKIVEILKDLAGVTCRPREDRVLAMCLPCKKNGIFHCIKALTQSQQKDTQ